MENYHLHPEYSQLVALTQNMSLKGYGVDVRWFVEHGAVANKNHPSFKHAHDLAKKIMRKTRWDTK